MLTMRYDSKPSPPHTTPPPAAKANPHFQATNNKPIYYGSSHGQENHAVLVKAPPEKEFDGVKKNGLG